MPSAEAMSTSSFEQFRELVLRDASLQAQLRTADNFAEFLPVALRLGNERGFEFAEQDVRAAWQAAQRAWIERWI